jgi:hypothetical protein
MQGLSLWKTGPILSFDSRHWAWNKILTGIPDPHDRSE